MAFITFSAWCSAPQEEQLHLKSLTQMTNHYTTMVKKLYISG